MSKVRFIKITLDDNVPEFMGGIIRCGSVIAEDKDGNKIQDHEELVDNSEFPSASEMIKYIANKLNVSIDFVSIEY
ncbi:hypothetical protein [Photobacterium carnosum]|uniref:hypothetical protein n=1 Tax=Photobacterium carnosum TaxID=2023717 RepID=UPI001E3B5FBD|nr:hypothetical protein [Photobacterium carnosum]MCD9500479.1 hypothetical protein [Photobacterium carnosum]